VPSTTQRQGKGHDRIHKAKFRINKSKIEMMEMTHQINYSLKIRLSDASYGTKCILHRNNKRLEIKIPPKTKDGTVLKLTNALSITDGTPGNIIVQIQIKPRPIINPTKGTNIDDIFQFCLYAIGESNNAHVNGYLDSRNNAIYRQLFFEKSVGAIWVAGWGAKQANTFLIRAAQHGFPSTFSALARWSNPQLERFMKRMHGVNVPDRAVKKWKAVHRIAKWLDSFQSECNFRQQVFRNLLLGRNLDGHDVAVVRALKLPYIGEANSAYIVRMLGGEEIKDDKWIKEFRAWAGLSFDQLEERVQTNKIPRGFFDVVMWEYCNMFVREVSKLRSHLQSQFGFFA
jgi:hypothetical protein